MGAIVNGIDIECITGDIASQSDMQAVVNAANAELRIGGGVAGALHRAAGSGLEEESVPLGPIEPGEAVITGAHGLPNEYVIHCLGPVYGRDKPEDELLASCYRTALQLAEENGISSIAFCAISTGVFGYPMEAAARVALDAVVDAAPDLKTVATVRFVLHDDKAREVHERALDDITGNGMSP